MATRFNLESTSVGTPSISPTADGAWESTGSVTRGYLSPSTILLGSTMTTLSVTENNSATVHDVLIWQGISAPLQAQTIGGGGATVKGQARVSENNNDADFQSQCVIRVLSGDGTSVTGTLLAADATGLGAQPPEWASSLTNRKIPLSTISPAATTSVSVNAGDRLVVEIGYRTHNASTATNRIGSLRVGSAAASDLAENETTTTDLRGWIEFSDTISFATDGGRRISQVVAEVIEEAATTQRNIAQVVLEVAYEAPVVTDYLYWGVDITN